MRTIVFAVIFLSLLICAETSALEHPSESPYIKTERVKVIVAELKEKIASLRESSSIVLLRTLSIVATVIAFIFVLGGLINAISMRGIMDEARKCAEETQKYLKESREAHEQIGIILKSAERATEPTGEGYNPRFASTSED